MHKDFNEKIENNFGLHKTDYPCDCRLERQQKSCDDLRSRIRELETPLFLAATTLSRFPSMSTVTASIDCFIAS